MVDKEKIAVSLLTLADLSDKMRDIDFAMLSTHAESGEIAGIREATTEMSPTMERFVSLLL